MTNGMSADALSEFFRRLADDRKLHNDYLRDPLSVMREARLDEEVIAMVLGGDLKGINNLLRSAAPNIICGTIVRM
jgi:hypothetical protein